MNQFAMQQTFNEQSHEENKNEIKIMQWDIGCGLYCNRFQFNVFVYGSIHGDDGSEDTYMPNFIV